MKRREAIVLLGGAVIAPLPLSAQSSSRVWRVGLLETTPMDLNAPNINAFRQSLQDLGYVEGQNLIIAYRSAEGRGERFTELTTELLRAGPRVSFMLPPSHEFWAGQSPIGRLEKRTSQCARPMSAFDGKADVAQASENVRF